MASLAVASRSARLRSASEVGDRAYFWWLFGAGLIGLGIRVGFVADRWHVTMNTDQFWYESVGRLVALGKGISSPFAYLLRGWLIPTGLHAPLTALMFVPLDLLGIDSGHGTRLVWAPDHAHELVMALLGAVTAALLGMLAGRLVDRGAGVVTALVAAAYPGLWIFDAEVMSEPLEQLLVAVTLLLVYRVLRRPSWPGAVSLGLVVGLDMLARFELVLLVPLVLIPVCIHAFRGRRRAAIAATGIALAATALVVAPWMAYMWTTSGGTELTSTEFGYALEANNTGATYYGPRLGYWYWPPSWHPGVPPGSPVGEAAADHRYYRQASAYIRQHAGRLPVVLLARVGRLWFLYHPFQFVDQPHQPGKWHDSTVAFTAWIWSFYVLCPFAVLGVWLLRRRRLRVYPLIATAIVVTVVALTQSGQERFRAVFEDSLVVLAGIGLYAIGRFLLARWTAGEEATAEAPPAG